MTQDILLFFVMMRLIMKTDSDTGHFVVFVMMRLIMKTDSDTGHFVVFYRDEAHNENRQ